MVKNNGKQLRPFFCVPLPLLKDTHAKLSTSNVKNEKWLVHLRLNCSGCEGKTVKENWGKNYSDFSKM